MAFQEFDFIADPPDQPEDSIKTGYCVCKHCGERVEKGIITISDHWFNCKPRIEKQGRSFWELITLSEIAKK